MTAGPRIVRVDDPRCAAAAVRASGRPFVAEMELGQTDLDGSAAIWFADGPGVLAQADVVVATALLLERPWTVVLCGESRDAGHPGATEAFEVDASEGEGGGPLEPTRVLLPPPEPIPRLLELGRLTEALAARDQLSEGERSRFAFLEVLRLNLLGRGAEALATADRWRDAPCRAEVLAELSRAAHQLGLSGRAEALLEAALGVRPTLESTPVDLAFWRARHAFVRGHCGLEQVPAPAWRWQTMLYRIPTESRRAPDAASTALRHGMPSLAARLVATKGEKASPYEWFGAHRVTLDRVLDALRRGDAETADALLEPARRFFAERRDAWNTLVTACDLLVAAGLSRRAQVHQLASRLRGAQEGRGAAIVRELWPLVFEVEDAWCAATAARLLIELREPTEREGLLAQLAELPSTPIALGPYELSERIAEGGAGEIWRARHAAIDKVVAIKLLRIDVGGRGSLEAFQEEVELLTRLDHPAIVAVYDHGIVPREAEIQSGGKVRSGQPYLVMEHLPAGTLASRQGALTWPEAVDISLALLDALAYAHAKGVLHRDIKPANILLAEDGTVRLTDFGLSSLPQNLRAGTPPYMAPEQFQGRSVGPGTDLYGLGCTVWTLVAGLPPWIGSASELARAHTTARCQSCSR